MAGDVVKSLNVLSLFDGISCGMVALKRAGFDVNRYVAYEIDKYATQVSQKNYPQIEHHGDVFDGDFRKYQGFDLLIGGSPCFTKGTLIYTVNGEKPIEDIKVGDMVLTHKKRYRKVTRIMQRIAPSTVLVKTNHCPMIECTKEHPFYAKKFVDGHLVTDECWISPEHFYDASCEETYLASILDIADSSMLLSDDTIVRNGYVYMPYQSVIQLDEPKIVYNLSVDEDESYVANKLIVHNCTYWSIAKNNREITPDGIGGQLFMQFYRAWQESKCAYFLYENNYSIHKNIKEFITKQLGVREIMINSAIVSAQQRRRCYWTNIPNVGQPEDKGILLKDVLESGLAWQDKAFAYTTRCQAATFKDTLEKHRHTMVAEPVIVPNVIANLSDYKLKKYDEFAKKHNGSIPVMFNAYNCKEIKDKSPTITASCGVSNTSSEVLMFEPVRLGQIGKGGQGQRIYSIYGKSVTLSANGGGQGAKIGLYFTPIESVNKSKYDIYTVKDGIVVCKDKEYNIDLPDGDYVIRKLTPVEAERLQTLPDNYTEGISNTQRYKCIGNGWTVDVIAHILSYLKNII